MVGIGRSLVTIAFTLRLGGADWVGFTPLVKPPDASRIWPVGLDPGGIALGLVMYAPRS